MKILSTEDASQTTGGFIVKTILEQIAKKIGSFIVQGGSKPKIADQNNNSNDDSDDDNHSSGGGGGGGGGGGC